MAVAVLSIVPSVVALGLAAAAAAGLALRRRPWLENVAMLVNARRALALATGIQALHFAEEAATGFHERFPALFGLPAMPYSLFVSFNVVCLVIWLAAIPGLRSARSWAFFVAWFLAIAGMLNLVAHPLLAVAAAGYFPGLLTAPLIGAAAILLWRRLMHASLAGRALKASPP